MPTFPLEEKKTIKMGDYKLTGEKEKLMWLEWKVETDMIQNKCMDGQGISGEIYQHLFSVHVDVGRYREDTNN